MYTNGLSRALSMGRIFRICGQPFMMPRPHPETDENQHKRNCAAYRLPSPRGFHGR